MAFLILCVGCTADTDGDALTDLEEYRLGTDPRRPDSDEDGRPDGDEVRRFGTDPRKLDTDEDGIPDGAELQRGTDPLTADAVTATPASAVLDQPPDPDAGVEEAGPLLSPDEPLPAAWRCGPGGGDDCFVRVPAGVLQMGAQAVDPDAPGFDPDAEAHEGPVHQVQVSGFWIGRTEVTISLWTRCVEAGACDRSAVATGPSLFNAGTERANHPINGITWEGAAAACAWLGGRLPTEAEWERAARGDDARRFPWGPLPRCGVMPHRSTADGGGLSVPDDAAETTCRFDGTQSTGRLRGASPWGALGMGGNVWEWVSDWYAADAYAAHAEVDPEGPADGTTRVQRGGAWTSESPLELRAALRSHLRPDRRLPDVGFRCVRADLGEEE